MADIKTDDAAAQFALIERDEQAGYASGGASQETLEARLMRARARRRMGWDLSQKASSDIDAIIQYNDENFGQDQTDHLSSASAGAFNFVSCLHQSTLVLHTLLLTIGMFLI